MEAILQPNKSIAYKIFKCLNGVSWKYLYSELIMFNV